MSDPETFSSLSSPDAARDARPPVARRRKRWAGAFAKLGSLSFSAVLLSVTLGMFTGVGAFTFSYGKGLSYLSSDPNMCINCHVMQGHFDAWQKSSHHHVAVCNDCHLPHNLVGKYVTKADNGFFHSLAFTLQNYRDPIQIKTRNRLVTQHTCLHCHEDVVHSLLPPVDRPGDDVTHQSSREYETQLCVHCHRAVGHAFR